jgi:hypothetical protein
MILRSACWTPSPGHVSRDGWVVALAADLVDLVDVDDAALRPLHVVIGVLEELHDDVLDVLTDVARLRERRGVGDGDGTRRILASVCARRVLPLPVGPSSRMLLLLSSTSSVETLESIRL